ncbi:YdgH/BhsA/McbA-like domain containing protein [Ewingella sp. S1.OA.A_B6]
MKLNTIIVAAVLGGVFSINAMAAELITKEVAQEKGYTSLGMVNVSGEAAPSDAKEALSKLADEKGGKYYVIIAGREHAKFSATAEVFK